MFVVRSKTPIVITINLKLWMYGYYLLPQTMMIIIVRATIKDKPIDISLIVVRAYHLLLSEASVPVERNKITSIAM